MADLIRDEYLLTSFHDADVDVRERGWTCIKRRDASSVVRKPDGTGVRLIFAISGVMMLPPFSTVHLGYGVQRWRQESDAGSVFDFLRAKLCVDAKGVRY